MLNVEPIKLFEMCALDFDTMKWFLLSNSYFDFCFLGLKRKQIKSALVIYIIILF